MPDIPYPDIIKQVSLQWQRDAASAEAAVGRACDALGIAPRKKLFGGRVLSGEEYRLLLDYLNQHGLR